ncbi:MULTISPECIES: HigA family addiction module antitoxin [unclassified Pseudoalteromonas]|uniref:HigA family addiction module antitoxin n=1 Tax=unclassified Pseudoalteromonas TaxID=194690 RepID=UPI00257A01A6|nr:HigA family addiction module antitoxin [Pseudoalteromonas sp.]|tara:strand:+ start:6594 stop:6962 length:369 start_codon:yes stop_codon:yes gene_type:complete
MTNKINVNFIEKAADKPFSELELKKRPDGGFRKHPSDFFKRNCLVRVDNLTDQEVAARLGITSSHLSNFLNEKVSVDPSFAVRLAKATGIDIGTWLELQRQYDVYMYENMECDVQPLYPFSR